MAEGQILALCGRGADLGASWQRASPGLPGGHRGQTGISGLEVRNRLKYLAFLCKGMNTNLSRGPYHFWAPSCIFCWTVREKVDGGSCCPQGCASEAYEKVCLGARPCKWGIWFNFPLGPILCSAAGIM
uniref:Uncharacterized protein n=1 Tax=Prolemur simus TaxID=1328070 RepID=A0A8C8ZNP1_PROSS